MAIEIVDLPLSNIVYLRGYLQKNVIWWSSMVTKTTKKSCKFDHKTEISPAETGDLKSFAILDFFENLILQMLDLNAKKIGVDFNEKI